MDTKDLRRLNENGAISRRQWLGGAVAAAGVVLVGGRAVSAANASAPAPAKPNSVFDGVRIGTITYSYRGVETTAAGTLQAVLKSGISEIELMSGVVDDYVGLSSQRGASQEEQLKRRLAVPMEKYEALRKMYNAAGVNIHIVKFDNIGVDTMTDEEIEECFNVARVLGAMGITRELSEPIAKRLGPFADKHKIWIGFHNHTQLKPTTYEGDVLSYGKYLGINFDIGHYLAGTGESPIPFIEKYHERIVSLHLKDRTRAGGNLVWGQGETPIKEVLQLMRKNKWTFPADIELEYPVPEGSTAVAEVARCVQYCKDALA